MKRVARLGFSLARLAVWLTVACLVALPSMASSWAGLYGGLGEDDVAWDVAQGADGGYLLVGEADIVASDPPRGHLLLVKLDAQGRVQWAKKMIPGEHSDAAYGVVATADGGYAVAASSYNFTTSQAFGLISPWVIRLDSAGNVVWQKVLQPELAAWGQAICATSDGGFAVSGEWVEPVTWNGYPFIAKLDANGAIVWQKRYGNWVDRYWSHIFETIVEMPGGGFLGTGVGGSSYNYVVRTDSQGEILWQKAFATSIVGWDFLQGAVCAGPEASAVSVGGNPGRITKMDAQGNIVWTTRLSELPHYGRAQLTSVFPAEGGGYTAMGEYSFTDVGAGLQGVWVANLSEDGTVQWEGVYGEGSTSPWAPRGHQASDGGLAAAGSFAGQYPDGLHLFAMKAAPDGTLDDPCALTTELHNEWIHDPGVYGDGHCQAIVTAFSANDVAVTPQILQGDLGGPTLCPIIESVKILQNPFRLDVTGRNYEVDFLGAVVKINGVRVPNEMPKNSRQIIAKKGAALKAMLPKGQPVCITVESLYPADSPLYRSSCFTFTR